MASEGDQKHFVVEAAIKVTHLLEGGLRTVHAFEVQAEGHKEEYVLQEVLAEVLGHFDQVAPWECRS